jgi:hypothetical protein
VIQRELEEPVRDPLDAARDVPEGVGLAPRLRADLLDATAMRVDQGLRAEEDLQLRMLPAQPGRLGAFGRAAIRLVPVASE